MIEFIQPPLIKPFFSHNNILGLPLKMPGRNSRPPRTLKTEKKKPWSTSLGFQNDDQV